MTIRRVARAKPEVDFKQETGEKWCAQGDDLRPLLGEFMAALPQAIAVAGLSFWLVAS